LVVECFAFQAKGAKKNKKGGKGKSKGKRPFNDRNTTGDEVPPGWDAKKWLARSKCKGCGSRWHRDCSGARNFDSKGKGGKGKKGGGKKGTGVVTFGLFMASLIQTSASVLQSTSQTLQAASHALNTQAHNLTCYMTEYDEYESGSSWWFPSSNNPEHTNYQGYDFVGWDTTQNIMTSSVFERTKRYGIMVDTGAVDSLFGSEWGTGFVDTCLAPRGLDKFIRHMTSWCSFRGIGAGNRDSDTRSRLPISVQGKLSYFEGQVLEGGEPAIWGLRSLMARGAILNLNNPEDLFITVKGEDGYRQKLPLLLSNGHLMVAIDDFDDSSTTGPWTNDVYVAETNDDEEGDDYDAEDDDQDNTDQNQAPATTTTTTSTGSNQAPIEPPPGINVSNISLTNGRVNTLNPEQQFLLILTVFICGDIAILVGRMRSDHISWPCHC
jgi:hypothetical protein